ncbi:MAG: hypothetical protein MUO63_08685 [Desulfobulbaceae bacterium]|nr:hypothetical protein [Desulfobulbaceae bacterium]
MASDAPFQPWLDVRKLFIAFPFSRSYRFPHVLRVTPAQVVADERRIVPPGEQSA